VETVVGVKESAGTGVAVKRNGSASAGCKVVSRTGSLSGVSDVVKAGIGSDSSSTKNS
jgi:hypothetical protein